MLSDFARPSVLTFPNSFKPKVLRALRARYALGDAKPRRGAALACRQTNSWVFISTCLRPQILATGGSRELASAIFLTGVLSGLFAQGRAYMDMARVEPFPGAACCRDSRPCKSSEPNWPDPLMTR